MKVYFQINYSTAWGEEVRIKLIQANGVETVYPLVTTDGTVWSGSLSISDDIHYQYCIYADGNFSRSEWDFNMRRVNGRMVRWKGLLPPKASYSVPRADSLPIKLGYVRHSPVGRTASCPLTQI